jgi:hypothetical protein
MKKLLLLIPIIIMSFVATAQKRIPELPVNSVPADSSLVPIEIGGVTKQTYAKLLSVSKLDSVKVRNDSVFYYKWSGTELFGGKVIGSGGGSGPTDLSFSRTASTVLVNSSTGADITLPGADASNAGVMTSSQVGLINQLFKNSYFQNDHTYDTLLVVVDDSTYKIKSVRVDAANSMVVVTPTITAGSVKYTVGVTPANFTGIPESAITSLVSDLAAKQGTITLTTTGTSGPATLSSGTLNIPQYSATGGTVATQDEGSALGAASTLNFVGAGVTASFSSGTTTVTIPGGGGGGTETLLLDWTTVTAGANITASINSWYTTYKYIRIEFIAVQPANATNCYVRISQDHSTFPTTGYLSSYTQGAAYAAGPANAFQITDWLSNLTGENLRGQIEIYEPNTSAKPSITWEFTGFYGTGSNNSPKMAGGGSYNTAGPIRDVMLIMNSGTVSGQYRIFGR